LLEKNRSTLDNQGIRHTRTYIKNPADLYMCIYLTNIFWYFCRLVIH
jgi:hypothetical protein